MYTFRWHMKKISVLILLLTQILLILTYFLLESRSNKSNQNGISFIKNQAEETDPKIVAYHTLDDVILLKTLSTRQSFIDFNSSLCYKNGTDLASMKISKEVNWRCNCLPGWHGIDCGQPEVLWRAVLANRRPVKITGPRTFERRLIYLFKVDKFTDLVADIRINELGDIIDLFVLYEDPQSTYLKTKLDSQFFKEYHKKILYVNNKKENFWNGVKSVLKNLRNDDIILSSESNEIPNRDALVFLKFNDHWPQPVKFRYRWSVFGFFWTHPSKTINGGGACTVSFLKQSFGDKIELLTDNKTLSSLLYKGITLGDLNHFGGWFCEYCNLPENIVEFFKTKSKNFIDWEKIDRSRIDKSYVEDLIENGVYVDGKTTLNKARKYSDNYFAPKFVMEHNWQYDFLLINFYSKLDYYEG